jgi:glucose-1-phosphate thymidylyltransferase
MSGRLTAVMVVDAPVPAGARGGAVRLTALEQVANRPIVHHVLDGLRQASVDQVIITGDADALIDVRASVRDYEPRFGCVDYAPCRDGVGLHSTLDAVVQLVGESPCLMHPADGLLDSLADPYGVLDPEAHELVLFMASGPPDGSDELRRQAFTGRDGLVRMTTGAADIALFGPGMLLRAQLTVDGGRDDLVQAGQRMAASGEIVRVESIAGWRRYRGDYEDLLELNRVALDRLVATPLETPVGTNRIEGRVVIDPTAVMRNSVVIGPTVIGAGAVINQAYIGPYTAVGEGARIEGTEIERSIVGSGAHVSHPGSRLVSSLVGRDARIFKDFSLPRGLRLWVGDGNEVALC